MRGEYYCSEFTADSKRLENWHKRYCRWNILIHIQQNYPMKLFAPKTMDIQDRTNKQDNPQPVLLYLQHRLGTFAD